MRKALGLTLALVALAALPVQADEEKLLTVGDRVASLDLEHYFSGSPVTTFDKNRVYILEFWATW